jgi:uncharacterized membrane protein YtjA (UPF0391 family)
MIPPLARSGTSSARSAGNYLEKETPMLYWAAVFFCIAIVAAFFGFFGIAAATAGVAKFLFFAFLVMAVVSFLVGRRPVI